MASDRNPSAQWQLSGGQAWVFHGNSGIVKPIIVAADVRDSPTDLAAFVAGLDHGSYSLLSTLRSVGQDMIVLGNDGGSVGLSENAETVANCVRKVIGEQVGNWPLTVLGIGRGAVTTRYSLARLEQERVDHQTANYFSYNGSAPSTDEAQLLDQVGAWPQRPRLYKVVSGDIDDKLDNQEFDDYTVVGDRNPAGAFISQQLGSWIVDRVR